jgi:hypothetical protein
MNELTETEKAYLAGFFDGEGCINISSSQPKGNATTRHQLVVVIGQCNEEFLTRWSAKCGIGKLYEDRSDKSNIPKILRAWHWRMHGKQAATFLSTILPYLDIKRTQAEIALKFDQTMTVMHHPGRRGRSTSVIQLRNEYERLLHELKRAAERRDGVMIVPDPFNEDADEHEKTLDSQLCLF